MPMLALNGYPVSIASGSVKWTPEERQRVGRHINGRLSKDSRISRRRWEMETTPMSWANAQLLKAWLYQPAMTWAFSTGTPAYPAGATMSSSGMLYSSAIAADGFPVLNAAKFGPYAGHGAYIATNLWESNIRNGTTGSDLSGFVPIGGAAVSSTTAARWHGDRSLAVAVTALGQGFHTWQRPISGFIRYFVSSYVRSTVSGATLLYECFNGETVVSTRTVVTSTSWQRVAMVATMATMEGFLYRVRQTAGPLATHYFDGFQWEINGVTPWVDGTRSSSTVQQFTFGTDGNLATSAGLTMGVWVQRPYYNGATALALLDLSGPTKIDLTSINFDNQGPGVRLSVRESNGVNIRTLDSTGFAWPSDDAWTHLAAVIRPLSSGATPQMALYVNGMLRASANPGLAIDPTLLDCAQIGMVSQGLWWSQPIDAAIVLPYPDEASAAALYQANVGGASTNVAWPMMTLTGDLLMPEGGYSTVLASITGMNIVPSYGRSGAWQKNQVSLSLLVEEG